jgi:hypothetical protein
MFAIHNRKQQDKTIRTGARAIQLAGQDHFLASAFAKLWHDKGLSGWTG